MRIKIILSAGFFYFDGSSIVSCYSSAIHGIEFMNTLRFKEIGIWWHLCVLSLSVCVYVVVERSQQPQIN